MAPRIAEKRSLFRGGFEQLLVLIIDVISELNGLVFRHPRGQIYPCDRDLPEHRDFLMLACCDRRIDGRAVPLGLIL